MYSLIVLPGVTPQRRNGNYLLVDSKDFTLKWCLGTIPGCRFDSVEIWVSDDQDATAFAFSRAWGERNETGSVLMTKSVWEGFENHCLSNGMEEIHIQELKKMCNIVEDLNVSN